MVKPSFVPSGIIVMWSGSINNIPEGWLLCDGTNGTPDLRDRFVLGTVNDEEIGDTGGNNSIVLTEQQLAPHIHTGNTQIAGSHTHTGITSVNGRHEHRHTDRGSGVNDVSAGAIPTADTSSDLDITGSAGDHAHEFTTDEAGDHIHIFSTRVAGSGEPIDITNPFYKLAFIMKS